MYFFSIFCFSGSFSYVTYRVWKNCIIDFCIVKKNIVLCYRCYFILTPVNTMMREGGAELSLLIVGGVAQLSALIERNIYGPLHIYFLSVSYRFYVNDWFLYVRNTVCDHLIFPRDFSNSVLGYFGPLLLSHSWLITVLYNYDSVKQSTLLEKNLKKILYRLQYQISLDPFNECSIKFDKLFRVFYTSVSSAFFTLGSMINMHGKYLS